MNYELADTHKELLAEMGKFCREELLPGAALLDKAAPEEAAAGMRSRMKKLAAAGYLELALGEDRIGQCVAGEELARACPSTFLSAMSSATTFGRALRLFGTEEQRGKLLPLLASGEKIGAFACTEAEAGSDLAGMKTTAEKRSGSWILRGEKDLVTNAPLADAFLVLAWTDPNAGLAGGTTLFLVDRSAEGISIGAPVETMGLRGALTAPIRLENCAVDDRAILGGLSGGGWGQMLRVLEEVKLSLSALCVGIGMACMEESTRHAKARKAFGKPIGLHEGVGAKLAIMFTLNDIGRMMTLRAAWGMEQGDPESSVLASSAKLFTSEAAGRIADLAMQIHGGRGYLKGSAVERLYRDARFAAIAYGTSEMQRAVIAKECLDRFRAA